MIRHSSSFLISIIIHTILLLSVFFAWKNYSVVKKIECEKKICLNLADVVEKIENIKEKKVEESKKVEKQKQKKIEKTEAITDKKETEIPIKKVIVEQKAQEPKKVEEIIKKEILQEPIAVEEVSRKEPVIEKKVEIEEDVLELKKENLSKEYIKINTQKIAKLLRENLYYPRSARKRNITGAIIIKFTLGVDAKVYNIKIVESKSDILSRAAIKTIENLSGVFPAPKEELVLNVPINYNLNY